MLEKALTTVHMAILVQAHKLIITPNKSPNTHPSQRKWYQTPCCHTVSKIRRTLSQSITTTVIDPRKMTEHRWQQTACCITYQYGYSLTSNPIFHHGCLRAALQELEQSWNKNDNSFEPCMQGLFIITPLSTLKQIIYRSWSILVSEEGNLVPQALPVSGRGNEHGYIQG